MKYWTWVVVSTTFHHHYEQCCILVQRTTVYSWYCPYRPCNYYLCAVWCSNGQKVNPVYHWHSLIVQMCATNGRTHCVQFSYFYIDCMNILVWIPWTNIMFASVKLNSDLCAHSVFNKFVGHSTVYTVYCPLFVASTICTLSDVNMNIK